ncbi:zf-HC2 domain-containing protein [Paenibacillus zeisoli]|uniref:Anti-sigma-W factor RsiW n=1 Tax=Paenibacillus zeisoli TaxID=2496267 RepID=A0A433XQS5_9BACL|nr:zf-HC2 domain-containing protein [Paenibacillus zeisoli]RUT36461.1 zf-HC2 domain-containing protein [Paenibacillus zeisoli]
MKCPEAVEWMHRYLDGDLSVEESDRLIVHLRSCDNCAEAFGLLKHLSDNLYQLPDVTPKYSIVDSILPKLQEIDRARAEEGSTLELTQSEVPLMRTVQSRTTQPKRSSVWRSRSSRSWVGGVAAAAVILGLFIYQHEPTSVPNAEIASTATSSSHQEKSITDENSPGTAASDTVTPSGGQDQTAKSTDEVAPSADSEQADAKTELKTEASTKDNEMANNSAAAPKEQGSSVQSSVPEKKTQQSPKKESASIRDKKTTAAGADSSSVHESASSDKVDAKKPADTQGSQENQVAEAPDKKVTATGPVTKPDNSFMGITSFPPIKVSPDGKYTAEVEQNHLKVYVNDGQSRTLLSDINLNGDWVKGEWSEDSKIFNYQTSKDEITKDYSINVDNTDKGNSTNLSQ